MKPGKLASIVSVAALVLTGLIAWTASLPPPPPIESFAVLGPPSGEVAPGEDGLIRTSEVVSIEGAPANLIVRHNVDALRESGEYEFYYEFFIYEFAGPKHTYLARSSVESPEEVSFGGKRSAPGVEGTEWSHLDATDFRTTTLREAIRWLRTQGKTEISWFSRHSPNGYEFVPEIEWLRGP